MASFKLRGGNERGLEAGGSRRLEEGPGPNHPEVLRTEREQAFL